MAGSRGTTGADTSNEGAEITRRAEQVTNSSVGRRLVTAATLLLSLLASASLQAAGTTATYMTPPAPIAQILDAPPTPSVLISPNRRTLAIIERANLPPISELARPILMLAGYRINSINNGPADGRVTWLNGLAFQSVDGEVRTQVSLPQGMRFLYPRFSPDGTRLAFVAEADGALELWVAERSGAARRLSALPLNAGFGTPFQWAPGSASLLIAAVPRRARRRAGCAARTERPARAGEHRPHRARAHLSGSAAQSARRGVVRALLHRTAHVCRRDVRQRDADRSTRPLSQPLDLARWPLSPRQPHQAAVQLHRAGVEFPQRARRARCARRTPGA
jgi:hypothetical protein